MMGKMNSAKKKWVVIGFLTVGLVAGMSVLGMKIYQNNQVKRDSEFASTLKIMEPKEMPVGVPVQGFYDYDPTEHKAMFTIQAVDANSKTMRLKFVFPFKLQGNEIEARVTCSKDNTKVYYGAGDQLVSAKRSVYEETRVVPGETVMQAICADKYCRSIHKYCELWLKE